MTVTSVPVLLIRGQRMPSTKTAAKRSAKNAYSDWMDSNRLPPSLPTNPSSTMEIARMITDEITPTLTSC